MEHKILESNREIVICLPGRKLTLYSKELKRTRVRVHAEIYFSLKKGSNILKLPTLLI